MAFRSLLTYFKAPAFKRRRIILLFVLGIVSPSLLLGYLAFRGIQNDRALLENERLEENRRIAERITRSMDVSSVAVEQAFYGTVAEVREKTAPHARIVLETLVSENPLIEQIFYAEGFEPIHFPVAKLLYVPDGRLRSDSSPIPESSLSAEIRQAQQLEFSRKDYRKAAAIYLQAFGKAREEVEKGALLSAVARVQKKAALLEEAASTYERLAQEYTQAVTANGIPLGLAARLELGSLFRELGDPPRSLRIFIDAFRSLLDWKWMLERSQYEFLSTRIKSAIEEFFSNPPAGLQLQSAKDNFLLLEDQEKKKRENTERVNAFLENAGPALEAKLTGHLVESEGAATRLTLEIGKHLYFLSILKPQSRTDAQLEDTWGIILDAERLKEDVLRQALLRHVSSEDLTWVVKDREGRAIMTSENAPSGPVSIRSNFAGNFPDWTLELHQPPLHLLTTFLNTRRSLYSYMFLLIAGILVFGLVLTIRSVSHELELARMKSDFVSTVSHEFKSPLASIRQLAEMLHAGRVPSEERRRQYYEVLLEQIERLSLLTDNILNLAKIEEGRGEFFFDSTDVRGLLEELVASTQDRVRHEGFAVELQVERPLPPIALDRRAVTQAIANLIDNAVKYSGESRKIVVRAFLDGRELIITVRDFGIGIQKDDADRIFERFYRGGDELTRTVKGSGLGLSLVKEIVEAHQGKVTVDSQFGKGSTFVIKLPLQR